jgi:hypothetical protein
VTPPVPVNPSDPTLAPVDSSPPNDSQTHVLLVFANWQPGRRDEFEAWYDRHVQDILRVPGFKSAQRFEFHRTPGRNMAERQHLVIYQIEGDPALAVNALRPAVESGKLQTPDPALVQIPVQSFVFSALGPKYYTPPDR